MSGSKCLRTFFLFCTSRVLYPNLTAYHLIQIIVLVVISLSASRLRFRLIGTVYPTARLLSGYQLSSTIPHLPTLCLSSRSHGMTRGRGGHGYTMVGRKAGK